MYKKYKIIEIMNNKSGKRDERFSYRIGRTCEFSFLDIDIGKGVNIYYPNGKFFRTSPITGVLRYRWGERVIITTKNRAYKFERI